MPLAPGLPSSNRRGFLKQVATLTAGTAAGSLGAAEPAKPIDPTAAAPLPPVPTYTSLGPDEAAFVEAMVNAMCPADELTPSGVDCGLAQFIDRQLAGAFGRGDRLYRQGPWGEGKPELGYQLPLTPEQYFKAGLKAANEACVQRHGKSFGELTPEQASAFLAEIVERKVTSPHLALEPWFNGLVYPLFEQACFSDPIYGGNANKVFWKMIGYPGLPATYSSHVVEFKGRRFPGAGDPKSMVDFS